MRDYYSRMKWEIFVSEKAKAVIFIHIIPISTAPAAFCEIGK